MQAPLDAVGITSAPASASAARAMLVTNACVSGVNALGLLHGFNFTSFAAVDAFTRTRCEPFA